MRINQVTQTIITTFRPGCVCVFNIIYSYITTYFSFLFVVFSGGDRGDSRVCLQDLALPHHPVFWEPRGLVSPQVISSHGVRSLRRDCRPYWSVLSSAEGLTSIGPISHFVCISCANIYAALGLKFSLAVLSLFLSGVIVCWSVAWETKPGEPSSRPTSS